MKKLDLVWAAALAAVVAFLVFPATHEIFASLSKTHPYMMAFVKFALLATMGELLAIRIVTGDWAKPVGVVWRAVIWGVLGMVIGLVFSLYAAGVTAAMKSGMLPSFGEVGFAHSLAFAFFASTLMNCLFAPTFMAFHRITDTYIDMGKGTLAGMSKLSLGEVLDRIDWKGFVTFVVCKTIPIFWIPAHTVTFMLAPEYRVMMAAMLSIALGGILAFAKKKATA